MTKEQLEDIKEMEKGNVYCAGGRSFSKEVIYLKQSIEQCNDKPIYYISRSFGNKYIVPQKIFEEQEKENARYKKLEEQLGCPLNIFIKLLFEQKIWIELSGKMYLTENIDFSIELELQEDETFINTLKDYGEATFWAWYIDNRRFSDHLVLRLKDYKKTWWTKEDKSE